MQTCLRSRSFPAKVRSTLGLAVLSLLVVHAGFVAGSVAADEPAQPPATDAAGDAQIKTDKPQTDKPQATGELANDPQSTKQDQPEPKATDTADAKPADAKPQPKEAAKADAVAPNDKPASEKKSDDKKSDDKKTDDKKPADKKSEDKKSADKKPEDKKSEDKKPEVKKPAPPAEPAKLPNIGSSETPMIPGQPWRVHDIRRPRPSVVTPGELSTYDKPGTPPSDAVVLFDGSDLSNWAHVGPDGPDDLREPQWKVENGYMEVVPRTGTMQTIESFGSCQLHIEWASPEKVRGDSQGRGNSGIKLMQVYEVQVLDSYNNRSYADGYAGAMYGQYPPMVNATRKPGQWQVYDIIFEAPKFKDDGSLAEPAYLTLIHNGVLLHHRRAYYGPTGGRVVQKYNLDSPAAPLTLQDHGNPVRFRNIWIRPLSF